MTSEIIPAILTDDPGELTRLVEMLKGFGVSRVHLDILDDTLVPGRTVSGWEQLVGRDLGVALDVHFMVAHPVAHARRWVTVPRVSRIIMHIESNDRLADVRAITVARSAELWLAISPNTPIGSFASKVAAADGALFLTVVPGAQGRPFRDDARERMMDFHQNHPMVPIMVDGGITPTTAPACATAGATHFVCGSFIAASPNPAQALAELLMSLSTAHPV